MSLPESLPLAHVLVLPSDFVNEPCMVPVSGVTTAKLTPPGSSMSATDQGLVKKACTRACIFGAEVCVFYTLSVVFLELSRRVGLPERVHGLIDARRHE